MAKFVSHLVSEIRGSINGATYARNRFGQYIRAKASPVQPRTPFQATARQRLTALAQVWRNLSEGQRNEWNVRADEITRSDTLGMNYRLTGLQLFISVNANRALLGIPRLDNPQEFGATPPPITRLSIGLRDGAELPISFTPTPYAGAVFLWCTPPLSPGVNFIPPSKYKLLKVVKPTAFGGNITSPIQITDAEYQARIGVPLSELDEFRFAVALTPVSYNAQTTAGYAGTRITASTIVQST